MYGYLRVEGRHGRTALAPHQCGLCHHLGAAYRTRARWLAGYDASVLVMLIDGLCDEAAPRDRVRCPIPLARRRDAIADAWPPLPAIAALQLFLAGEKLFDDRVDRDGALSSVAERLLRRDIREADAALEALGFPLADVRATLRRQPAVEADPHADLDALAAPTADALETLVRWLVAHAGAPHLDPAGRFAARLGRLLYLVDALHDLPDDLRRGRFNPLTVAVGPLGPDAARFVAGALAGRVDALASAFDALPLTRHADVLRRATVDSLAARGAAALRRLPTPATAPTLAEAPR